MVGYRRVDSYLVRNNMQGGWVLTGGQIGCEERHTRWLGNSVWMAWWSEKECSGVRNWTGRLMDGLVTVEQLAGGLTHWEGNA